MTKNHGMIHADTLSVQPEIERFPIVEVRITPVDTVLNYGDKILLDIRLENKGKEVQKLLFDRPAISTGGPWSMFGRVIDVRSNKSVVKMGDKSGLSSQLFSENQLKDKYYHLKPGQSVEKRYGLTDIVTLDSPLDSLPRGTYAVQLVYEVNQSNVVIIKIQ